MSRGILSPNFVVQRIGREGLTWLDEAATSRDTGWLENCLATGTVNGDLDSRAVMDLCWNTRHNVDKQQRQTGGSDHQPMGQSDRHGLVSCRHVSS